MLNLLIITQKVDVNDDVLGFFHEWIRAFSEKYNKVTVICLKLGQHHLPSNVGVLSLGKEQSNFQFSILKKLKYLWLFYKYIWQERNNYNAVFVHMNPKYVVLGWPVWKYLNKTISLWYAHGHVPPMLKVADWLTDIAFASTKEGYRIDSSKLKIVGQGIDVEKFRPIADKKPTGIFKIITVGRISPSKDYETLIRAVNLLTTEHKNIKVEIIGDIAYGKQQAYLNSLKNLIRERGLEGVVYFKGPVPNKDIVPLLQSADIFVNMGHTGSLDKANLEAMACGLPVLTCNEAFRNVLGDHRDLLMYPKKDFNKLAEKIRFFMNASEEERVIICRHLRAIVIKDHNLNGLIEKITKTLTDFT